MEISPKTLPFPHKVTLFGSLFVIALCGLTYELLIGTISSYFLGDSIYQFSITIGFFLFSMGLGAYLSRLVEERLLEVFLGVEVAIGALGGVSALLLFYAFAAGPHYQLLMIFLLVVLGALIGVEIPLVARILKEYGTLRVTLAQVLSLDYLGALAACLLFPLVFLPQWGLMRTSFFFGLLNEGVVLAGIFTFGSLLPRKKGLYAAALGVAVLLLAGLWHSAALVRDAESRFFAEEIILTAQTKYQRAVFTHFKGDFRLYLDGGLQFSSADEYRYHEVLIHPAMGLAKPHNKILILGGGDGLALREILKYPEVEEVTLVDLDRELVELLRRHSSMQELHRGSLSSPKVKLIYRDALEFLAQTSILYDVIVIDLPDPKNEKLARLYSVEFFRLCHRHLAAAGVLVTQATSPYFGPQAFWCIGESLQAAGFYVAPMQAYIPSFGNWGFFLASLVRRDFTAAPIEVPTKFLNGETLSGLFVFPKDQERLEVGPSHLDDALVLKYYLEDWKQWE